MALDPVAVALKFGFLIVLYLFLVWMARSALKDLRRGSAFDLVALGQEGRLPRLARPLLERDDLADDHGAELDRRGVAGDIEGPAEREIARGHRA